MKQFVLSNLVITYVCVGDTRNKWKEKNSYKIPSCHNACFMLSFWQDWSTFVTLSLSKSQSGWAKILFQGQELVVIKMILLWQRYCNLYIQIYLRITTWATYYLEVHNDYGLRNQDFPPPPRPRHNPDQKLQIILNSLSLLRPKLSTTCLSSLTKWSGQWGWRN